MHGFRTHVVGLLKRGRLYNVLTIERQKDALFGMEYFSIKIPDDSLTIRPEIVPRGQPYPNKVISK
jgi:hypothetical protein